MLEGRESLLSGLVSYRPPDGTPCPAVDAVIQESAANLGLTAAHLAGIVATVTAAASAPRGQ